MCERVCFDCGYLAVRERTTRALVEVDYVMRQTGKPPVDKQYYLWEESPACFVHAWELSAEHAASQEEHAFLSVITRERKCNLFTPWRQGFSPKEHREIELIAKRRAEDEARAEQDRQWRAEQAEIDRKWRAKEARDADKRHQDAMRVQIRTTALSAFAGFLGGLAAALLAFWLNSK